MTDRNVRQIGPPREANEEQSPQPFSAFADQRNIVLLGDPGAGKTHLFQEAAQADGGHYLKARAFLNIPTFPPNSILYVDSLDERRAGRGDQGTIDAIVQKLFTISPAKVRISCRVVDWLGETDLAAFQPYFDLGGSAIVLHLERLTLAEQQAVLAAQEMNAADADAFIDEAQTRGLQEYLDNPQSLIMLLEAVRSGSWPETRKELFELSTRLLLSESNRQHANASRFDADELRGTVGAICSARLISDVAGISLGAQDVSDVPSYRSLTFLDLQKVEAGLGRRAFEAGPVPESVDYGHRTTAEFLGAAWLADAIRAGLPLGRVLALIGVDGRPTSELRGLHAWLTVFLPEHADRLIEADPYGVLTYGDAASLTPSARRYLLDALGRLSERDPWFRSGRWQAPAIGALARPDMVDAFRDVLRSDTANFGLRSVVVDALAKGTPLPALRDDLATVLTQERSPFAERLHAMLALLRLGAEGKQVVVDIYRGHLGDSANALRLRSEIIAELYGDSFGPQDVARLMGDVLASEHQVPTGSLWSISDRITELDIPAVLNGFEPIERQLRSEMERQNVWEVASTFERFLFRALQDPALHRDTPSVWKWLSVRHSFRNSYGGGTSNTEGLREILHANPMLLRALADRFLYTVVADANRWSAYFEFGEITTHAIRPDDLLDWIVAYLPQVEHESEKEKFLYEIALSLVSAETASGQELFAELYAMGDTRDELREVRDRAMSATIPAGLLRRNARRVERDVEAERSERQRKFEANAEAISSGAHLGWLAEAARVYFGLLRLRDDDGTSTPPERLARFVGEANVAIAMAGFVATLSRPDVPNLETVASLTADRQLYSWWYALVLGLDERWRQAPRFEGLSDDLLRAVLAIAQANLVFARDENGSGLPRPAWLLAILEQRPELARDAYMALAKAALRKGAQHIEGLYELLGDDAFARFRREIILELLRGFPNTAPSILRRLLLAGLALPAAHPEMLTLARNVLPFRNEDIGPDQRDLWLTAAYFLAPREFEEQVDERAQSHHALVFALRDFSGYERYGEGESPVVLPIGQLKFLARLTGSLYPEAPFPSGVSSGDQNPWDASEFMRYLVNAISALTSEVATDALVRLENDDRLASYRPHIRHAQANQRTRRREAEYDRPDWRETLRVLNNGRPVNVSDLHSLLLAHLEDIKAKIAVANNDVYKSFWNEDKYGRITTPKTEESCRDVLVGLLRTVLLPLDIVVEPEGHMARDRRADISVAMPGRKILFELKRDWHANVWSALEDQLDRFYTIDPDAKGFGVYGVFWFGAQRPTPLPLPPSGLARPDSAEAMERMLREFTPAEKRSRLAVVVIDVSGSASRN
jgi:predicted NACHT family NTPase